MTLIMWNTAVSFFIEDHEFFKELIGFNETRKIKPPQIAPVVNFFFFFCGMSIYRMFLRLSRVFFAIPRRDIGIYRVSFLSE